MEWWSQFVNLLTYNEYFRAGFIWGLATMLAGLGVWGVLHSIYVRWLKVRQFFEPIKKPGKPLVETGPSPASMMFSCLGQIFVTILVLSIGIAILYWFMTPQGG